MSGARSGGPPEGSGARSGGPPEGSGAEKGGSHSRRPHIELVSVDGNPTDTERAAALEAIVELTEEERRAERSSVWLRSARAQGRRLGMYDYRDRFEAADAWRLSARFPAGGREYPGRNGRGDAK